MKPSALPFVALLLSVSCTALRKDVAAVESGAAKLAKAPAIELVLHGEEAAWVKAQVLARGGVADVDAVTLGCLIIYLTPGGYDAPDLRRHEYKHCQDWRADPLGFPIRYQVQTQLVGYLDNPFEIAARAAGDDPNAPTADADR